MGEKRGTKARGTLGLMLQPHLGDRQELAKLIAQRRYVFARHDWLLFESGGGHVSRLHRTVQRNRRIV
jgi:hypothetical protein